MTDPWDVQTGGGSVPLPAADELLNLLLRQLAELTSLSTPYLSQLERGTHQPAVRVLKLISRGAVFLILAWRNAGHPPRTVRPRCNDHLHSDMPTDSGEHQEAACGYNSTGRTRSRRSNEPMGG